MTPESGAALLVLARAAIARALDLPAPPEPVPTGELAAPGASFVTLTLDGELRGCIGSLEAHRPLAEDVRANAVAAALRDPRFKPLTRAEFARTRVEVSLLSPPCPLACAGEADAAARLRPGVDGVVLTWRNQRATFLPQVWEQLPEPRQFLAQLKRKAGLAADFWSDELQLSVYQVRKWKEAETVASP